jgi:radical SAM-linked protein
MHRLRLKFSRGEKLKYLSHLDLMRLWERALRRAGLTPAYSEGYSPHPRISLAAPLPVGVTSQCEVMDVFLVRPVSPITFVQRIVEQLPEGIGIVDISPVNIQAPSLQSQLRFAEYVVEVDTAEDRSHVEAQLAALMSKGQLAWHHTRDTGERYYDLRALIDDLWFVETTVSGCRIGMRLRCDASGSGRPEQVAKALGFDGLAVAVHRINLVFV